MFFSATGYQRAGAVSKETKGTMSEPAENFTILILLIRALILFLFRFCQVATPEPVRAKVTKVSYDDGKTWIDLDNS